MTDEPAAIPKPSVKERAVRGVLWTAANHFLSQALRFGSNIILTRLLVPEAFGLVSLVWVFIMGLELLSDVGVGPAVIRSAKDDDRELLDTAWTVQVIRGFILFALSILLAWPVALFYKQPQLVALIIVAGFGIVIRGFTPARVHTMNRKLLLGRLTLIELGCQAFCIAIMVVIAWTTRSVWALVVGTVSADALRVVLCYWLLPGSPHRFRIDRTAIREIIHTGRWIIVSTALTYAVGNLDKIVIGKLLSVTELGVYSLAIQIIMAGKNVGRSIEIRVLFPALAETLREAPDRFYARLRRARLVWIFPTVAGFLGLFFVGDYLIRFIYRQEFWDAGWMLRVLAAGAIASVINDSAGSIWPALGEFRTIVILMAIQILLTFGCMYIGYRWYGTQGFIVGVACVELLFYPVQSFLIARRKLWQPEVDMPVFAVCIALVLLGLAIR